MDPVERFTAALADRYAIVRVLGAGGMATVYLATDLKHDRLVAIKTVRPDLAASLGADRFLREIRIAARLQHPHILPLYDSGAAGDTLFYVMPYVEGESLRDRLARERQLPIADALEITRQVASALGYAHGRDVVHRDIKPENILLSGDRVLVADFGIARAITESAADRLTGTGLAIGTAAYMSPEQAAGEAKLDGRSDQYSLACVLYEMVVGAAPFEGESVAAMIAKRFTGEPVAPRVRGAAVSAGFEAALRRAMSLEPGARFDTVTAFAEALAGAMPASPAEVAEAPSLAVLPFLNLSPDPDTDYFADGITEELINDLARVPGLRVASRTSVFACKQEGEDVRRIGRVLGVGFLLEGSVRRAGTQLRITAQLVGVDEGYHLWAESYDRELADVFAIQEDIAQRIAGSLKLRFVGPAAREGPRAHTPTIEAYNLYLRGRHHWNNRPAGLSTALGYFEQACAADPEYALAHTGVADCYATLGSWESGAMAPSEAFTKAGRAARRALALDASLGEAHTSLAHIALHNEWDWPLAEAEFLSALTSSPQYATAHHWHSHYLMASGRVAESLAASRRCLEIDPLDPVLNTHLAWHHVFAREYEEAIEQCRVTAELYPASFWPPYFTGFALAQQGRLSEAAAEFARAEQRSSGVTFARAARGYTLGLAGRRREAAELLAGLEAEGARGYVPAYDRALIHIGLGDTDRAFEELNRALNERSSWMAYLGVEPRLDSLRAEARFSLLLRHVGIASARSGSGASLYRSGPE